MIGTNFEYGRESKILYREDMKTERMLEILATIKKKNETLAMFIEQKLDLEGGLGVREDVLLYFSNCADYITKEPAFIHNLVELIKNKNISPKWYEWINSYYRNPHPFSMDDFFIVLNDGIEKGIPFESIKIIFEKGKEDILSVYTEIEKYTGGQGWLDDDIEEEDSAYWGMAPKNKGMVTTHPGVDVVDPFRDKEMDYGGLFKNLLSVVTSENKENVLAPVQEHLSQYAGTLQNFANEITAFSMSLIQKWQNDKDEIQRIKALYELEHHLVIGQQKKINEMRGEIIRLNEKIQDAERAEQQQEIINQKISELQSLSGKKQDSGGYSSYRETY